MNKIKFPFFLLALGFFPAAWPADPSLNYLGEISSEESDSSSSEHSESSSSSSEGFEFLSAGGSRSSSEVSDFPIQVPQFEEFSPSLQAFPFEESAFPTQIFHSEESTALTQVLHSEVPQIPAPLKIPTDKYHSAKWQELKEYGIYQGKKLGSSKNVLIGEFRKRYIWRSNRAFNEAIRMARRLGPKERFKGAPPVLRASRSELLNINLSANDSSDDDSGDDKGFLKDFKSLVRVSSKELFISLGGRDKEMLPRVIEQVFKNPDSHVEQLVIRAREFGPSQGLLPKRKPGGKYYKLKKLWHVNIDCPVDKQALQILLKCVEYAENFSGLSLGMPVTEVMPLGIGALKFVSEHFKKLKALVLGSYTFYVPVRGILDWAASSSSTSLPGLKILCLFGDFGEECPITVIGKSPWAPQLTSLELRAGAFLHEAAPFHPRAGRALCTFPLLEGLRLCGMDLQFLSEWPIEVPCLKVFQLWDCIGIKVSDICNLLQEIPSLIELEAKGDFVDEPLLDKPFISFPEDRVFHLSLSLKKGSSLRKILCGNQLSKYLRNLEFLGEEDKTIEETSQIFLPVLTKLRFSGSLEGVEGLEKLMMHRDNFPQLKLLDIESLRGEIWTRGLREEYAEKLRRAFKDVEIKI